MNEFIEKSKNLKKILQFGEVNGAIMAFKSNFYYIVYDIDIDDYYLLTIENLHSCTMGLKHTWIIICSQSHRLFFAIFILVPRTIFYLTIAHPTLPIESGKQIFYTYSSSYTWKANSSSYIAHPSYTSNI